jgi:hypothetical protein
VSTPVPRDPHNLSPWLSTSVDNNSAKGLTHAGDTPRFPPFPPRELQGRSAARLPGITGHLPYGVARTTSARRPSCRNSGVVSSTA